MNSEKIAIDCKSSQSTPPILFLLFNRPDLARQTLSRIRSAQPAKLFIAVDGPRPNMPTEAKQVAQCQALTSEVDWDCEVETLFQNENLGCRTAISSSIDWFFEHVQEGIILEDDCVPDQSFFPFCEELLFRYRSDSRVMVICGENYGTKCHQPNTPSYIFSGIPLTWGWATWRRSWNHYQNRAIDNFSPSLEPDWLRSYFGFSEASDFFEQEFTAALTGKIDTWGYRWIASTWLNHGLTIQPTQNLVTNIGYDNRATHTQEDPLCLSERPAQALRFPLIHPEHVRRNYEYDRQLLQNRFSIRQGSPSRLSRRELVAQAADVCQELISRTFRRITGHRRTHLSSRGKK